MMTDPTESASDASGNVHYNLVMPFVVTKDHGGPYDDDSYVAGWEAHAMACFMKDIQLGVPCRIIPMMPVRTANIPQLDLLAMRFGWTLESFPIHTEGEDESGPAYWSNIVLHPATDPTE